MASIKLTVTVKYRKASGPKADPDEVHEAIEQGIEAGAYDSELSGIGDNGTSEYEVTDVSISHWETEDDADGV